MNAHHGAEGAARQLLDYLETERERRCAAILERARTRAARLEKEARHRARVLVREAVRRERARREAYLRDQRARIDARFRTERFRRQGTVLERCRQALAEAFERRWRNGVDLRRQWLAMAFAQAAAFLPDGGWQVVHPADWDREEADDELGALRRTRPGVTVTFQAGGRDPGICITCSDASVDARPAGLLAVSARVDGLLLRALENGRGDVG